MNVPHAEFARQFRVKALSSLAPVLFHVEGESTPERVKQAREGRTARKSNIYGSPRIKTVIPGEGLEIIPQFLPLILADCLRFGRIGYLKVRTVCGKS